MAVTLTAPGVYIQELPSGSRTITGVSTSLTAFVGRATRGPVDTPTKLTSWAEFERRFGGLWVDSPMSQAVRHYFLNGGAEALIVRVVNNDAMVLRATEEVAALAGFDRLRVTVAGVAALTFTLTIAALDANGDVLVDGADDFAVSVAIDLSAPDPAANIAGAMTATTPPITLAEVVGDVLTAPPPARTWVTTETGPGEHTVAIGSQATTATARLATGLLLRATAAAQAVTGFDHLVATVANSNTGTGTFDLTVAAADAGGTIITDGTDPYSITLAGLDVDTDYAATINAQTTATTPPIALVTVPDGAPTVVAPNGSALSTLVGTAHEALLATTRLQIDAVDPGTWGNRLRAGTALADAEPGTFHFSATEVDANGSTVAEEVFYNVSPDPDATRSLERVLELQSQLVRLADASASTSLGADAPSATLAGGDDGGVPRVTEDIGGSENARTGMYALVEASVFNLLCLPLESWSRSNAAHVAFWSSAATYCTDRLAFLLIDPPEEWTTSTAAIAGAPTFSPRSANAALYFPRIRVPDPLRENRLRDFPPCGVVAGAIARTDGQRGIWKAPAGIDVGLVAVTELTVPLTDPEQGDLNQLGINCLRSFPVYGRVIWGARTLNGADLQASEWKYLPVRRLVLYLEQSLQRGTRWAVFEPNGEPLWSELRLGVGAFMQQLFRQGAFAGASPQQAYFVKCDSETTTTSDIGRGIVNVLIGFAPLRPAEFVIIKLQQLAAQAGQ